MATRIRSDIQVLSHLNGTATTSMSSALTVPTSCTSGVIQNTDGTNNLLVTFDSTLFWTVYPRSSLAFDVDNFSNRGNTLKVKSSASTVTYEILFGAEV